MRVRVRTRVIVMARVSARAWLRLRLRPAPHARLRAAHHPHVAAELLEVDLLGAEVSDLRAEQVGVVVLLDLVRELID